jgi:hypothetical protein
VPEPIENRITCFGTDTSYVDGADVERGGQWQRTRFDAGSDRGADRGDAGLLRLAGR